MAEIERGGGEKRKKNLEETKFKNISLYLKGGF